MRALALTTRFRQGQFEADACLLVYDELTLEGSSVGDDIRDVLDSRPNTPHLYVLAPFLPFDAVKSAVRAGTGAQRASSSTSGVAGQLSVLGLGKDGNGSAQVVSTAMTVVNDVVSEQPEKSLPSELRHGWLFNLFDLAKARIDAPPGVHFGKMSGKHSDKFLRTSAALLSTRACATVAFFALAIVKVTSPRRIFVDTAPLLSVAFAMGRIGREQGLWEASPPAQSFSSYGGLDGPGMPALGQGDVFLISASTTGGLAKRLVTVHGANPDAMATLYRLRAEEHVSEIGGVVCDLTYLPQKTFGYAKIKNYEALGCPLCRRGFVLASLEGDQFLMEKLGVKRVRVVKASQAEDARAILDLLVKRGAFDVQLYRPGRTAQTDVAVDVEILLKVPEVRAAYLRLLTRFTPAPVNYVVLEGISQPTFASLANEAGLSTVLTGAKYVTTDNVALQQPVERGNALVAIGYLNDHATLRSINAQLRLKVPQGCVSYLSAMTIAESPRSLSSLKTFLSWGEHGSDTFVYRGALEFMLPRPSEPPSAWDTELELLQRLVSIGSGVCSEHSARLARLQQPGGRDSIFLPGLNAEIAIANDFAYLDTKVDRHLISQADIYAAVCNAWVAAKCDNNGLRQDLRKVDAIDWRQTVYGQVLLCPSNFSDYNDAILRAAFLRACRPEELCYAVDERCSAEVLDVCLAELANWPFGKGDALPEFLLAMATRRLTLTTEHMRSFKAAVAKAQLPKYLAVLAEINSDG